MMDLLQQLYELRRARPALFRRSPYSIERKGAKETNRLKGLLQSCAPTVETVQFLQQHKEQWTQDAAEFWKARNFTLFTGRDLPPQAQMAFSYVAAMRSDL